MKIYIAHNFEARLHLRGVIKKHFWEHEITSTWIFDDTHLMSTVRHKSALTDVNDINRADCLLLFVDQFGEKAGKGKFWEWGYAVGTNKLVILVGRDYSCIFWHLERENILRYATIEEAVDSLKGK